MTLYPSLSALTVEPDDNGGPEMTEKSIEQWWPELHTATKQWFRQNLRAESIESDVALEVYDAGGPDLKDTTLAQKDWDFIETQSEFVD
jgi:hypothetical protein